MKRTCDGCKALWYHAERNMGVCVLDHNILELFELHDNSGYYRPLEECPKPKTKQKLLECLRDAGKVTPV